MKRKTCCLGFLFSCLGVSALALLALAIALAASYPAITGQVDHQIDESVTIEKGHATYEQLQNPTLPVWKDFYFFNLTNPEGFAAGEKPNLTEIGPYSYRENRTKYFTGFSSDLKLLTYNQTKIFHFDNGTSGSGLNETDLICTINVPLITAILQVEEYAKREPTIVGDIAKQYLKSGIFKETGAQLYVCQEARRLAWNYTDPLVERLHTDPVLNATGLLYPSCCVNLQVNNSANDSLPSTIHTGVGDIDRIGEFQQWDGHRQLDIWFQPSANEINGTEGLFFRPNLMKGETLQAFVDDVVRSFTLQQKMMVEHRGLKAWRYELDNTTFLSPSNYPPNARWGSWEYDGVIYLGVTRYPVVPIYGSKPHFLDGDPILREKVEGLHPDPSKHDTDIDVEIYTGANIQFRRQLQINVKATQNTDFPETENLNGTLYYPVLYVNEHAELTNSFKHYLESKGLAEVLIYHEAFWPFVGILFFLAVVATLLSMTTCLAFLKTVRKNKNGYEPVKSQKTI